MLKQSKFKEHGRITPEEFIAAGDFLAYKFGSWSWDAGDKAKRRDYFPDDKQFLVTRNVPCLRRVAQMAYTDADEDAETLVNAAGQDVAKGSAEDDADDWVATHSSQRACDLPPVDRRLTSAQLAWPGRPRYLR